MVFNSTFNNISVISWFYWWGKPRKAIVYVLIRCLIGFVLLDLWFSVYCLVDCCLSLLFRRSLLVLFRFTTSDYPFGICTYFIHLWNRPRWSYIYNWLVRSFFPTKWCMSNIFSFIFLFLFFHVLLFGL